MQILSDGEFFVETWSLENDADPASNFLSLSSQIKAENFRLSALTRDECRQESKKRRFASPVGTEKDKNFSRSNCERNVAKRLTLPIRVRDSTQVDSELKRHGADYLLGDWL